MCLSHKKLPGNEEQAEKDTLTPLLLCSNLLMMHFRNRASLSAAGMKYH